MEYRIALDPADKNVLVAALTRWCQGYMEPFPDLSVKQARRIIAHFSAPSDSDNYYVNEPDENEAEEEEIEREKVLRVLDMCGHVNVWWADEAAALATRIRSAQPEPEPVRKFKLGDLVYKKSGSQWHGKVVGFYSTELTPFGVCVESIREIGSVQIYPERALEIDYDARRQSKTEDQSSSQEVP